MRPRARLGAAMALCALALCALSPAGCAADWRDGDEHFFLAHEGASMPVWVTGNWRSNRIIVHVHGGPGTTNAIYYQKQSYQRLAADYGIVYYEQRASGAAQGTREELINVGQFVEDLDQLMIALAHRYPAAEFVLMGHSWGGHLTASYLLDAQRQARVRAWVLQDGMIDASCRGQQHAVDDVLRRGVAGAAEFYRDVWRCDLETNVNNLIEQHQGKQIDLHHSEFVRAAGGYDVNPDGVLTGGETAEIVFRTQFDLLGVTARAPLPMQGYYGNDLTPRLGAISVPTLVLWGTRDLITHHATARPAFEAIGAPAARKELVLFENSGHNPWAEEQEKFYQSVAGFLQRQVWPSSP